jgi:iron(III) transport system ATP-binding protein
MNVSLRTVSRRLGAQSVLRSISLEVQDHELFFLLGPSGCGKTTLLRLLAGFYQPDEGEVWFGERRMNGVPPHRRNTGMVFQNYALWPHLTVAENVAYGLEVRRFDAAERRQRVAEALAMVRMEECAARSPAQLSGGQQQRVALARALVVRPDVLLLDEPLSNLDARLRLEMREEIRRIHRQTRITTVYVTHDQKESLSMADRLAVMREGRLEQVGDPRSIYRRPVNRFVADFIGETNWLQAEVRETEGRWLRLSALGQTFQAEAASPFPPGAPVWLGFRPEAAQIGPHPVNGLTSVIEQVTYLGEVEQYVLRLPAGAAFKVFEQNPLELRQVGAPLLVHIAPHDLLVLPRD